MIAAVSGASGFIGSAVLRNLVAAGRQVRALVEPGASLKNLAGLPPDQVETVTVDVCDFEGMARALEGCATYFHLAAIYKTWLPDPSIIYRVNLEGTTTSLLAAKAARVGRVVYTSSIAAVGLRPDGEPSDESVDFNLYDIANEYILTKYLSERIALRFAETMPIVVVNPAFPFGPRDIAPTPTGGIILSLLRGQVPAVGDGGFCAIDVEDVAAAHVAAETAGRVGERYILGNHNVTYEAFFRLVGDVAGVKAPPRLTIPGVGKAIGRAVGLGMELWADHVSHKPPVATYKAVRYMERRVFYDGGKARRELGMPSTPLRASVERAVKFFRDEGMV
jgi:dihydroflavonol-4-reductase